MTALALPARRPIASTERLASLAGMALTGLVLVAIVRGVPSGIFQRIADRETFLAIHLATVIPALPLGAWLLASRKGDRAHRLLGRLWAILMIVTAIVSFGVRTSGHLSWIHLFSVLVLVSVPRAVILAIRGDIQAHARAVRGVYIGLVAAGIFTFLPGRLLGQLLLG